MDTKNPIYKSGFSNDAFERGIWNGSNNITTNLSCKHRCGSKNPPHANEADDRDPLTHIYVGENALERCADGYYWTPADFPVSAMALPPNRCPYEFAWPVKDRRVIILSSGDCDYVVYQLGHALIICGALEVIGTVNDETVKWIQPVELRRAA